MERRTFEGTWEEILLHASELIGQRVKLTVLSSNEPERQQTVTLDQLLKGRVGRVRFQPSNLSIRTKEAFADGIDASRCALLECRRLYTAYKSGRWLACAERVSR